MNPPDLRKIYDIPPKELDRIMSSFFMSVRKTDASSIKALGDLYQPDTLTNYRNGWQRVLFENKYPCDITKDRLFETSRKVLAKRRKQLVGMGLGNKPLATRSLTNKEVDHLFANSYFGITSPLSLQRAIWWKISTSFGYRARDESRKLCFGDIKLLVDENAEEFLEWDKERGSKTRTGEVSNSHQRAFNPRAYATGGSQCPIKIYKEFVSKRPLDANTDNSPFFLAMVPDIKLKDGQPWYYNRPLGKNKLGEFMSNASRHLPSSSTTGTSRSKVANHSVRKTSISSLLENDVNPLHVSQLSGHKNVDSLNSYYVASKSQQQMMSNIINRKTSSQSPLPSSTIVNSPSTTTTVTNQNNHHLVTKAADKAMGSAFFGANITNCTFNVNCYFTNTN